jgi:CheY-like chemotaxis protein
MRGRGLIEDDCMNEKILYVDDDQGILSAVLRAMRKEFHIVTAPSGPAGLEELARGGPFAVVVSDMRMPEMDGVEFLSRVGRQSPQSTRVMLTGNADVQTAMQAVNEGHIFRFLTKPCRTEILAQALRAGIEQHRLVVAEQQLLAETLNGAIRVLCDVLSLASPAAFGRANRLRVLVVHMSHALRLPEAWQFEVAAVLSQIGCVSLPAEIVEKAYVGQELTRQEQEAFASHPAVCEQLLGRIPRLENVAKIVAQQMQPASASVIDEALRAVAAGTLAPAAIVAIGANMLRVALEFDKAATLGLPPQRALENLRERPGDFHSAFVESLHEVHVATSTMRSAILDITQLGPLMVVDQDVRARSGCLILARGQELTLPVLQFLRRWHAGVGVESPLRVLVPQEVRVAPPVPLAAAIA